MRSFSLLLGLSALAHPLPAEACGGGMVSARAASVAADAQRIFISARGATTEVVTQIVVPESAADYGALIPVPAQPTLDAAPVDEADLAALDDATAPRIYVSSDEGGGEGCGCPVMGSTAGGDGRAARVEASAPVDIGPVTAVVLTGETGAAVNGWLEDNGFVIADANRPLVDAYSGSGKYFIAIRRNDAVTGGPSSIGMHFTLPGDQRSLPLRFASIGAAPRVAFMLFVAASSAIGPSGAFAPLTLDDLDADILRDQGYAPAVEQAVAAHDQRAFVLEGTYTKAWLEPRLTGPMANWIATGAQVTRLSTILSAEAMTEDVRFDVPHDGPLPSERYVRTSRSGGPRHASTGALFALTLAAASWRRRRR